MNSAATPSLERIRLNTGKPAIEAAFDPSPVDEDGLVHRPTG